MLLALILVVSSAYGQCGAICLYEVGHPLQGASSAGAGAAAQDASTAFFNPAGMTRLHDNEIQVGTVFLFGDVEFDANESKTITEPPGQTGDGGSAGGFTPAGSAYAVMRMTDDLRLGLAFNGLYGGSLNYNDDWVGRTYVTDSSLTALNIEPTVAYRMTDWLSVGAGLNIVYAIFEYEAKVNSDANAASIKVDEADDWAVGATFGVLLELSQDTRVGIVYRLPIDLELSGDFENPSPQRIGVDVEFTFAQGVNVSVFHQLTPTFSLLADAGWSDWSDFSDNTFIFQRGSGTLDRDWKDTWRVGIGMQYQVLQPLMLRAGFSYDSSPVRDSDRLPDLPVDEQYRFSFGIQQELSETLTASVNYTFVWPGGPSDVDEVTLPSNDNVTLDGEYNPNVLHILGFTVAGRFYIRPQRACSCWGYWTNPGKW